MQHFGVYLILNLKFLTSVQVVMVMSVVKCGLYQHQNLSTAQAASSELPQELSGGEC